MSKITENTVRHISHLARLEFSDNEIGEYTHHLGDIVKYVEKLNELDVSDAEPTFHTLDIYNKFREDQVISHDVSREEILSNAPQQAGGCFKVPDIVDSE